MCKDKQREKKHVKCIIANIGKALIAAIIAFVISAAVVLMIN